MVWDVLEYFSLVSVAYLAVRRMLISLASSRVRGLCDVQAPLFRLYGVEYKSVVDVE